MAGRLLQRCRTRWLGEVGQSRRALLVGEGNGRMLEACAVALPHCHFTVLDTSEAMLARARLRWKRAGGGNNAVFSRADMREWRADGGDFDLLVTNFFLDCFCPNELPRVITNISNAAASQARWLVADFAVPPSGWQRIRAQTGLALAYRFFRATTGISARRITNPEEALQAAGFVLNRRERFSHGLLHSDLWTRVK